MQLLFLVLLKNKGVVFLRLHPIFKMSEYVCSQKRKKRKDKKKEKRKHPYKKGGKFRGTSISEKHLKKK